MSKFKVGDRVISKNGRKADTVQSIPGMDEYDRYGFSLADRGFILKKNGWEHQEDWNLAPNKKTSLNKQVNTKPVPCSVCKVDMRDTSRNKSRTVYIGLQINTKSKDKKPHKEELRFNETFKTSNFQICIVCLGKALGLKPKKK